MRLVLLPDFRQRRADLTTGGVDAVAVSAARRRAIEDRTPSALHVPLQAKNRMWLDALAETLGLDTFNVNGYDGSVTDVDSTGGFTMTAADSGDTITYDTGGTASGTVATSVNITDSDGNSVTGTLQTDEAGNHFVTETSSGDVFAVSDIEALSDGNGDGTADDAAINVTVDTSSALGAKSETPLGKLDSAISDVDSQRSELGAMQNRFDSAITNLSTTETNLSSARSRIEDADYADEVSNMTRNQILQQAGTSVLAQANQLPQHALSLLG